MGSSSDGHAGSEVWSVRFGRLVGWLRRSLLTVGSGRRTCSRCDVSCVMVKW